MFNLHKKAAQIIVSTEKMLAEHRDEQGLAPAEAKSEAALLADSHKGDTTKITDKQLTEVRSASPTATTQKQLDDHKAPEGYVPMRNDYAERNPVMPMDLLDEAHHQEHLKDLDKASSVDGGTEFWDKYVNEQMVGEVTKQTGQVPESGSQLQNSPDRFKGLTENNLKKKKVEKMVMASLMDLDAKVYQLFHTAAKDKRKLTGTETAELEKINSAKLQLLSKLK